MFKLMGSLMIGASCIYLGLRRSMSLRRRQRSLENIQNTLSVLETEISFGGTDLKNAFLASDSALLKEAAKTIDDLGIKQSWGRAVKKWAPRLSLSAGDADALLMLGRRLGMTDTENQIKNIEAVKNMLDIHIGAARNDADNFCRLYAGGGVLAGVFIVLMLL